MPDEAFIVEDGVERAAGDDAFTRADFIVPARLRSPQQRVHADGGGFVVCRRG